VTRNTPVRGCLAVVLRDIIVSRHLMLKKDSERLLVTELISSS